MPGYGAGATSRLLDRRSAAQRDAVAWPPLLRDHHLGVPRDLPRVAIWVLEIRSVATPERGVLCRLSIRVRHAVGCLDEPVLQQWREKRPTSERCKRAQPGGEAVLQEEVSDRLSAS